MREWQDQKSKRILGSFSKKNPRPVPPSLKTDHELAKIDLQAISDFLDDKPFFLGDEPHAIDASLYAILTHILNVPFASAAKDFGLSKKNLVHYCARIHDRYGV